MSDEPCPRSRDVDRHDVEIRELRRELQETYVLKEVFDAHVGPLERDKASRRNALLAVAGTAAGVVLSVILTYLITRGGH